MKNSPHRMKHEQRKAIRQAQKEGYLEERGKSKKNFNNLSDGVSEQSDPQKEVCWAKTLQKKTLETTKYLQKRLQRFKIFKKTKS